MLTVEEAKSFQKNLLETGGYQTDPNHPVSLLGRCDWWYKLRLLKFLVDGNLLVRKGGYDEAGQSAHSYTYLKIIEDCGGKFDISGAKYPDGLDGQPCVFVGNHMSLVEGFGLPILLLAFNRVAAVAKESLQHYPIFGAIAKSVKPISVKRVNPREDLKAVLEQGEAMLKDGRSIVLFPQATRSPTLDRKLFNSLGVKLAKKANVPIIPLALKTDFQQNGTVIKDIGPLDRSKRIYFRFGAPLMVEGKGKETNIKIMDFIEASLTEWSS